MSGCISKSILLILSDIWSLFPMSNLWQNQEFGEFCWIWRNVELLQMQLTAMTWRCRAHTNTQFLKWQALKFIYLLKAINNSFLWDLHKMFCDREEGKNVFVQLRGVCVFQCVGWTRGMGCVMSWINFFFFNYTKRIFLAKNVTAAGIVIYVFDLVVNKEANAVNTFENFLK